MMSNPVCHIEVARLNLFVHTAKGAFSLLACHGGLAGLSYIYLSAGQSETCINQLLSSLLVYHRRLYATLVLCLSGINRRLYIANQSDVAWLTCYLCWPAVCDLAWSSQGLLWR